MRPRTALLIGCLGFVVIASIVAGYRYAARAPEPTARPMSVPSSPESEAISPPSAAGPRAAPRDRSPAAIPQGPSFPRSADRDDEDDARAGASRADGPQAPRGENPEAARRVPRERLAWNVWAEPASIRNFKPAEILKPGDEYRVLVHLSGLDYEQAGVSTTAAGGAFKKKVEEWMALEATKVDVKIVLLPDSERFERPGEVVKTFTVDMVQMQRAPPGSSAVPDAFKALHLAAARDERAPFVYGEVEFILTPRSEVGPASVAFSVWVDGRPIEEFFFEICIAPNEEVRRARCPSRRPMASTLRGVDSVRLAAEGGATPDGALHFIQMYRTGNRHGQIKGLFWRKIGGADAFVSWSLDRTPEALAKYLAETVMPHFFKTSDPETLKAIGRGLYNVLFPDNEDWRDAAAARAAFEAFLSAHPPITDPTPASVAPSVFVRTMLPALQSDLLLPLTFVNVNGRYVGESMRVELPLPVQSYRKPTACISRWVMALPPQGSEGALGEALNVIAPRIGGAEGWDQTAAAMYRDIGSVRRWLSEKKTETEPTAFIVTSHHDQQSLYFKASDPLIPDQIERTFAPSSLAILNGCGTGEPGAIDIINHLSQRKVDAVIATATTVKGEMAGWYLACLADTVKKAGDTVVTLGQLHFVASRCLSGQKGRHEAEMYGARALAYMLIGNGSLRLCLPRKGA